MSPLLLITGCIQALSFVITALNANSLPLLETIQTVGSKNKLRMPTRLKLTLPQTSMPLPTFHELTYQLTVSLNPHFTLIEWIQGKELIDQDDVHRVSRIDDKDIPSLGCRPRQISSRKSSTHLTAQYE
jgi:hypothetical protein